MAPRAPGEAAVDGEWVWQRAVEAVRLADEVRQAADRARRSSEVQWESVAATAFRGLLEEEVRRLLRAAASIDEAAAALRAHAAALEALAPVPLVRALVQQALQ